MAPCRLSCQISANQREAETSANENKHWKTRAKDNDVITNLIPVQSAFRIRFFDADIQIPERKLQALSLVFPPRRQNETENLLAG